MRRRSPQRRVLAAMSAALMLGAIASASGAPAGKDHPPATAQQHADRRDFTDAEILDGFFKTAFGAEYHLSGQVDRIRKFDGPVRVYAEGEASPGRRAELAHVVEDIAARVKHLDIAMTEDSDEANVTVHLLHDRNLNKTITSFYGRAQARDIHKTLDPQCLSGFRKNDRFEIIHSDVLLTIDNGDFVFLDCAYEELLQSLGPINDTDSVPWTMFNDDVQKGYFDVYDQYLMNILYHPEIKPGMTVHEVKAVLPQVLRDVRAFVERGNSGE